MAGCLYGHPPTGRHLRPTDAHGRSSITVVRRIIDSGLAKLRSRLAEDGLLLRGYRAVRHFAEWLRHERRQAVDTSHHVSLESLGVNHPDRERYEPASWKLLRTVLPRSEVAPGDVFIDIGSGMGRVVQQAATYPFARVIGVEVSDDLNEIARRNFARNNRRVRCGEVEFVTADATEFAVPDDTTHVYMFNPFTGETFRKVLQNLIASIDQTPRRLVLIYEQPEMKEEIEVSGRFELLDEKKTAPRRTTLIYESRPEGLLQ